MHSDKIIITIYVIALVFATTRIRPEPLFLSLDVGVKNIGGGGGTLLSLVVGVDPGNPISGSFGVATMVLLLLLSDTLAVLLSLLPYTVLASNRSPKTIIIEPITAKGGLAILSSAPIRPIYQ